MTKNAPKGLGLTGRRLWRDVAARYELRPDEASVLESACRMSDRIDDLEEAMRGQDPMIPGSRGQMIAHPLLAEIRMQRVAVSSLLRQLKLPDEGEGAARNQQRDAAVSRWTREYSREVR